MRDVFDRFVRWNRDEISRRQHFIASSAVIFTAGGVVGFVLSNAFSGAPTIGASGAIFGLFAALIVYGRWHGGSMMAMMTRQIWQWAIMLFVFGFMMSGVNNYAHLGGFIGGWIASRFLVSGSGRGEGLDTIRDNYGITEERAAGRLSG